MEYSELSKKIVQHTIIRAIENMDKQTIIECLLSNCPSTAVIVSKDSIDPNMVELCQKFNENTCNMIVKQFAKELSKVLPQEFLSLCRSLLIQQYEDRTKELEELDWSK